MSAKEENSPKINFQESDDCSSDSDNLIVREEADSSEDLFNAKDSPNWEQVDESIIAVDYSNVHVFLKTLSAWNSAQNESHQLQSVKKEAKSNAPRQSEDELLVVNLDKELCD